MNLAKLVISLELSSAGVEKGFEKAAASASHFAEMVKGSLEGIGIAFGLEELFRQIDEIGRYEEEIRMMGKSVGMTTEQMSEMAYVVKAFDIPLHDLTMGLAYFDRVSGGLMRSKQGRLAVQLLGLNVRELNGQMKNSFPMLMEMANKFSKLKDSAAKTAAATAFYGQTYGLEFIRFLDQGSAGIKNLTALGKKLGMVFNDKEALAGQAARQSVINMQSAMKGLEIELMGKLFPALTLFMELLLGDSDAAHIAIDKLKELGIWAEKIGLGGALGLVGARLQKNTFENQDKLLEADIKKRMKSMTDRLMALAGLMHGDKNLIIPPNILQGTKVHIDRVANAIRGLRDELTGLSEGAVAKGIQHLKELGASPAQLAQGQALLTQIHNLQAAKSAQKAYASALSDYGGKLRTLSMDTSGLDDAHKTYLNTLHDLNALSQKGVDITNALRLAREQYRQTLLKGIQTPGQMNINAPGGLIPGSQAFAQLTTESTLIDRMTAQAAKLGQTLQSSFVGMIVHGQTFSSVLKNLTTLFAEFLLKSVVFKQLSTAFGVGGFGGLIGSFFGGLAGGKASGGPVTAGSLYMVGESGPELFAPGANGTIIPNGGMTGAHGRATVNIDARGADAGVEHRVMRAMQAMRKQMIGQSLVANYEYQARGGSL